MTLGANQIGTNLRTNLHLQRKKPVLVKAYIAYYVGMLKHFDIFDRSALCNFVG